MILRAIRGRAGRSDLAALRAALDARLGATPLEHGLARFHVGARQAASGIDGELEVLVISFWLSAEHAVGGDAREISPLALARRHVRDLAIVHFEIDETILRHANAEPVAIRMATGRFSRPGADAEMLNLLRQRAPLLGDEMVEAYVGRRLDERAVEVTFISTWSSVPADRPLEEAFWPDIALHYDQFTVEVYDVVGVESA